PLSPAWPPRNVIRHDDRNSGAPLDTSGLDYLWGRRQVFEQECRSISINALYDLVELPVLETKRHPGPLLKRQLHRGRRDNRIRTRHLTAQLRSATQEMARSQ